MIKFEHTEVLGWEHAIRGMRNPMNSWEKSDSYFHFGEVLCNDCANTNNDPCGQNCLDIGPNDQDLMMRLAKGGPVHAKYRRMIVVYVDITAPLYWWKEFDTYKVGTVANSCSTMHKIAVKEFSQEDFSREHLFGPDDMLKWDERKDIARDNALAAVNVDGNWCYFTPQGYIQMTCNILNHYREKYLETQDKRYWWQMIQLLPSSYNQRRTVMLNYEVLAGIYPSRKDHKLDEWREFCDWIVGLPYSEIITGMSESEKTLWVGEKLHEGFKDGLEHPDPDVVSKFNSVLGGYPVTSEDIIANAMAEAYGYPPIDPKKLDPAERTADTARAIKNIMDRFNRKV